MIAGYKYTEFAHELVDQGRVRIGTLYDYRNVAKYGQVVGDLEEGSGETTFYSVEAHPSVDPLAIVGRQSLLTCYLGGHAATDRHSKVFKYAVHNAYVFCCSWQPIVAARTDLGDRCVLIRDIAAFADAVKWHLPSRITHWFADRVVYRPKRLGLHDGSIPNMPFWKTTEYSWQNEFRVCFVPEDDQITPVIVASGRIATCCTLLP